MRTSPPYYIQKKRNTRGSHDSKRKPENYVDDDGPKLPGKNNMDKKVNS